MNKIIHVLAIAIMWAAWVAAFYFFKDWEFYRAFILALIAAAVAFGYATIVLITKALK